MASVHRERKFEEYRKRSFEAKSKFKTAFFLIILPFGGLFVGLMLYYFIRALALLAGGSMYFGQIITNYATGRDEELPLAYTVPHLLMLYLFFVSVLAGITHIFKVKGCNTALKLLYVVSFVYGFITIFNQSMELWKSVILMVGSFYGFWCCDVIGRQLKEFKFLSQQEGYPDFIDLIGEPVPIANTRGVYMRQYEELKKQAEQRTKEKNLNQRRECCVDIADYLTKGGEGGIPENAMDELTTDFNADLDELLKNAK